MTLGEKKIIKNFNLKWSEAKDAQSDLFKEILYLKESRGGGKGGSLQSAFEYLMTSEDSKLRYQVLHVYQEYYRLQGYIDAQSDLFQDFVNKVVTWS